jgi:hypothetical protein
VVGPVKGESIGRSLGRTIRDLLFDVVDPEDPTAASHPFRPQAPADVPDEAWEALERVCPDAGLDRLFVIPAVVTGRYRGRRRSTPAQVLAFGDDVIALWTAEHGTSSVAALPAGELLAVDDRTILLHGRLAFIGARGRIAVTYNTVARDALRENMRTVRCAIAGPPVPATSAFLWLDAHGVARPEEELPYKWAFMLSHNPNLRLDPTEPVKVAVGDVVEWGARHGRRGRTSPATGLAILGPREFVVATEPAEYLNYGRYGVDLTTVPRRFLNGLAWDGRTLRIGLQTGDGRPIAEPIVRSLDGRLVEAMARSFGSAVRWT